MQERVIRNTPGLVPWMGSAQVPAARSGVILSVIALFLSGWAFISSFDEDLDQRRLEQRLACLELPGANECGVDDG